MMIKLAALCSIFFGCSVAPPPISEPLFRYSQTVTYRVPYYYSLACTGKGEIRTFEYSHKHGYSYTVIDKSLYCPYQTVNEQDIMVAE